MPKKNDELWKYAPLWTILFAAVLTLLKSLGTRYILNRTWNFHWSDVGTAFVGALLGYVSFRTKYEKHDESSWYTR